MDGINAQIIGKHVIVGVTRLHNRLVHIDTAVSAFLVIAEAIVTEHEVTRIEDAELRCALAQFQCRQCHVGLEGGAGRITADQCTIEQRFVERCIKFLPAFRVDTLNEKIRIVGGHRYVSKNIARFRLNGYQRTATITKGFFHDFLQLDIDRQNQIVTSRRCSTRKRAVGTPPR